MNLILLSSLQGDLHADVNQISTVCFLFCYINNMLARQVCMVCQQASCVCKCVCLCVYLCIVPQLDFYCRPKKTVSEHDKTKSSGLCGRHVFLSDYDNSGCFGYHRYHAMVAILGIWLRAVSLFLVLYAVVHTIWTTWRQKDVRCADWANNKISSTVWGT